MFCEERELLCEGWRPFAAALGIEFEAPIFIGGPRDEHFEFACLLPQFAKTEQETLEN